MYSKIKQFLDAAPKALKSANEIYNFARNKYKQVMGVFPDGLDDVFLKRGSAEMQDVRQKVVKFPEGGKDKTDFFSTRPDPRVKQPEGAKMDVQRAHENLSGGSNYAQGDTKYNADVLADEIARQRKLIPDDGIADSSDLDFKTKTDLYDEAYSYLTGLRFLNKPPKKEGIKTIDLAKELEELTNKNLKDKGLGNIKLGDKLPPPKNKKPDVDPVLQKSDDQKQMFLDFGKRTETDAEIIARMNKQNKDSVQRLKDKKEKDLGDKLKDFDGDPDAMAQGGRIGFNMGGDLDSPSQPARSLGKDVDLKLSDVGVVLEGETKEDPFSNVFLDAIKEFKQNANQPILYTDGITYYPEMNIFLDKDLNEVTGPSKGALPVKEKNQEVKPFKYKEAASGGRIGFNGGGGAGFAGNQMEGKIYTRSDIENDTYVKNNMPEYVMSDTPGSPRVPMGPMGPANVGIFGGGGYSKNQIVPGVDMATTNQNYGIAGQIPIGNTGFTIGGDYMKSRANERFTGDAIPGQTFKSVPTDSDRFNVGINFRKQFKEGSKPPNPGRRNFMKLMAGLASLPMFKFLKPAAKVKEAVPVVAEGAKLGFDNFMLLVDKIKRLGKDVSRKNATQEREKVTRYQTNDNEYELIEDLSTGDIRIVKDRMGGVTYGDEAAEVINDRSVLDYKSPQSFYNNQKKKGGKTPAEYEEVKEVANRDGTFDDYDEIDDLAVQEMLEEIGKTPVKKAGGGLAYMLGE
jgi:hypothetical protein